MECSYFYVTMRANTDDVAFIEMVVLLSRKMFEYVLLENTTYYILLKD